MKEDNKTLIKIDDTFNITVTPPRSKEKKCTNLHQAILYLRRK